MSKLKGLIGKLRYNFLVEWYNFLWNVFNKRNEIVPNIASIEESIDKIAKDRCSVSRLEMVRYCLRFHIKILVSNMEVYLYLKS